VQIDFGFLNDKPPVHYQNKPVFVIILLGTSDGHKINFFRLRYVKDPVVRSNGTNRSNSAAKLQNINPINEIAYLTSSTQLIECYVMCDDLGQYYNALHSKIGT
jgi:ATP-dependent DNA helicase HFM1/MER3